MRVKVRRLLLMTIQAPTTMSIVINPPIVVMKAQKGKQGLDLQMESESSPLIVQL
jgi:hypothetical protein